MFNTPELYYFGTIESKFVGALLEILNLTIFAFQCKHNFLVWNSPLNTKCENYNDMIKFLQISFLSCNTE